MRIGIDARWVFREVTGIGNYAREVVRWLAALDRENEYVVFLDRPEAVDEMRSFARLDEAPNFSTVRLRYGPFSPWGQLELPALFRTLRLDVFHSPNYMIPLLAFPRDRAGRTRCVVTLHDIIPLLFRRQLAKSKKGRLFPIYRALMLEITRRADLVITVSSSSRADLVKGLHVKDPDRVIVIHNGVRTLFVPPPEPRGRSKRILYVGRFDPYKNVPRLVEAFSIVRKSAVPDARLRIIGPPDERFPEAPRLAETLGVAPFVEWTGYLEDKELVRAYQEADVLVLPSSYEGFGLPTLEAMACGTPVVCSNSSSLPEVVGDAAILVGPADTNGLADAMARVLTDEALRRDLRAKGFRRAAQFSWRRTAELTLETYRQTLSRGS